MLATYSRLKDTYVAFMLDNKAVYDVCRRNFDNKKLTNTNFNRLVPQFICSLTSSIRFNNAWDVTEYQVVISISWFLPQLSLKKKLITGKSQFLRSPTSLSSPMLNLIPEPVNIWLAASCTDVIQKNFNAQENNLKNGA